MDATITSVSDLITALGGPTAAGEALGATPQMVVNWRDRGAIPARRYLIHSRALKERGIKASPTIWSFAHSGEAA